MSLPDFDPEVHHIGLGPQNEGLDGYFVVGAYRKDLQRFPTPQKFGSADAQLPAVPHLTMWTQDDFLGGQYGYTWGEDDQQFSECRGMLPSQVGRSLRTVPPLVSLGTDEAYTEIPLAVFGHGQYVYVVFAASVRRFDISSGGHTDWTHGAGSANKAAALDVADGAIWLLYENTGAAHLTQLLLSDFSTTRMGSSPPSPYSLPARGVEVSGSLLSVAIAATLYTVDVPDDRSTAPTWVRIGRLPGKWKDSLTYNGLTYILCADEDGRAQLVSFNGTDILPITDFPANFRGECITVYGGRLYVGGSGREIAGSARYAELWEVVGASLRLVRTFAPESRVNAGAPPECIWSMVVHEGLLFLGTQGPDLLAYDVTTDSFYGGPELGSPGAGTDFQVRGLASGRERLMGWLHEVSEDATLSPGLYRGAETFADIVGGYSCSLTTSDFNPDPARDKRWSRVAAVSRYGAPSKIEVSVDGGATWQERLFEAEDRGDFWYIEADLLTIPVSRQMRVRFTIDRGTVVETFTELVAFTVSFLFLDTGQYAWAFTVNAAEMPDAILGGVGEKQDVAGVVSTLHRYARERTTLDFFDLDGETYTVHVRDVKQFNPEVLPTLPRGGREALMNLVLVEV